MDRSATVAFPKVHCLPAHFSTLLRRYLYISFVLKSISIIYSFVKPLTQSFVCSVLCSIFMKLSCAVG